MNARPEVVICGRCGAQLIAGRCGSCGALATPAVPVPPPSLWRGPWPAASPLAIIAGTALDLIFALGVASLVWSITTNTGFPQLASLVGTATFIFVLGIGIETDLRLGHSLGHRIVGARLLDTLSGLPAGSMFKASRRGRLRWVSNKSNPLRLVNQVVTEGTPPEPVVRPALRQLVVTAADGTSALVGARLVAGRYPMRRDPGANSLEINDLTRTLGRRHVEIAMDGEHLVITDLGSANGTSVSDREQAATLTPFVRTAAPIPCTLMCGEVELRVDYAVATSGPTRRLVLAAGSVPARSVEVAKR